MRGQPQCKYSYFVVWAHLGGMDEGLSVPRYKSVVDWRIVSRNRRAPVWGDALAVWGLSGPNGPAD